MGKLLQRLQDASRSGIYRMHGDAEVEDALRGSALALERVSLQGAHSKKAVLSRLAQALEFPRWFGGNWDALADCLKDLSWREAEGYVLVLTGQAPPELIDVLADSAEFWKAEGKPFFALFVDPDAKLALPELFRKA